MVFLDGTVLDTADPASREAFLKVRALFRPIYHSYTHPGALCSTTVFTLVPPTHGWLGLSGLSRGDQSSPAMGKAGTLKFWLPLQSHKPLVDGVVDLAKRVQADRQLSALIRRKFAIKCTTGYCSVILTPLNAPVPSSRVNCEQAFLSSSGHNEP